MSELKTWQVYILWTPHKRLTSEEIMENLEKNIEYHSTCLWCGGAWNWKKGHSIKVTDNQGCFPCCEDCWGVMTLEEKIECMTHLYNNIWEEQDRFSLDDCIEAIKKEGELSE